MTNKITYITGRDYGAPQVLEISYSAPLQPADNFDFDLIPASFVDAVRGISGQVNIFPHDATPAKIGRAVLAEYDAGRY